MQLRHNFASDDVAVIIFTNSGVSATAIICSAANALKSDSAFR